MMKALLLTLCAAGLAFGQPGIFTKDDLIKYTPEWKGDRFADGRPKVPDAILAGGRSGWPAILSSLKSVLETGTPLSIKMEPQKEMMDAVQQAVAGKPWLK